MKAPSAKEMPWVIAQVDARFFALTTNVVNEMVIMPETCAVPGVPGYVRGVLNLRGKVIPLIDLRKRLGMTSSQEEMANLCALMEQRARDHRHWLDELVASVKEKRRFTLAVDPHQCAFGKWYDVFQTDNIVLAGFLKKFDGPHNRIHALAGEAGDLVAQGHSERALELLEAARATVLAQMLELFRDIQVVLRESHREIAIVLNGKGGVYAVCVDSVASVEKLPEGGIERLEGKEFEQQGRLVSSIAKRSKGGLVLILDLDAVLDPSVAAALPQMSRN